MANPNFSFTTDPSHEGVSIEDYLLRTQGLAPRSALKRAFKSKQIRVDGRAVTRQFKLSGGMNIHIFSDDLFSLDKVNLNPNSDLLVDSVVHTDDLIVINKPSGMNSHPLKPTERDTALNAIAAKNALALTAFNKVKPLDGGLVHRLDRGTSGLLACALHHDTWQMLRAAFSSRNAVKVYLAWLEGKLLTSGSFEFFMAHDLKSKKRMNVFHEKPTEQTSWWTKTELSPIHSAIVDNKFYTLTLIRIHTGVTHQIRASCAHIGHPVASDPIYANVSSKLNTLPDAATQINTDTAALFESLRHNFVGLRNPAHDQLPKHAFFLHAYYLKVPGIGALETGIIAPAPPYFGG